MVDYDKVKKWTRIITILGSILMIAVGIGRFFNVFNARHPIDYIVNIYLILLGVFFILFEIPIKKIEEQCLFLTKYFGKFLFSIFLGLLCFNSSKWFTIAMGVVWWVIALIYFVLFIIFFKNEMDFSSFDSGSGTTTVDVKRPQAVEIGSTPKP